MKAERPRYIDLSREIDESAWRNWLEGDGVVLTQCGLPPILYSTARHFGDFMYNGCLAMHDGDPDFDFATLSTDTAWKLYLFLKDAVWMSYYDNAVIPILRERLGISMSTLCWFDFCVGRSTDPMRKFREGRQEA